MISRTENCFAKMIDENFHSLPRQDFLRGLALPRGGMGDSNPETSKP
jgi:hypothetical protein